mmetsp:Transcript_23761/g.45194  ORF Transcript_23761/g.45194 Transcript_23761/m.45194 type:complete len:280 (+) Transcript_23761:246-1085(+)|eukprot:CAMPEP_0114248182 /NCGR_PEP_ID=MMETSP0058-20121206/13430_1 /TAXON_ID=36894 /ORGANISM="Pyramimonas parkeae, CCMP726" /LENGTH=279 /DNA_ID=CAMNT_0001361559 /DNA_START=175 /DNA_END=1014 /DNA_ORIENTATION=-
MAVSKKSTKNPPTVLSAVLDYTASTITLLILDDAGAPYVRVLVDAPDAQAASDVQMDLVSSSEGFMNLEFQQRQNSGLVKVELPMGTDHERIHCKFRKRAEQLEVKVELINESAAYVLAAGVGDLGFLKALYSRGFDPCCKYEAGVTPLISATQKGHHDVVKFLIGQKVAIDDPDDARGDEGEREGGRTALAWAAWHCYEDILGTLLTAGANPNVQDVNGETPLMVAARTGHVGIINKLLKAGAKKGTEDNEGWTAINKAHARGHEKATQVIYEAMRKK